MNTRITFMHRYELISRSRPMSDQIRLARGANHPRCVPGMFPIWVHDFDYSIYTHYNNNFEVCSTLTKNIPVRMVTDIVVCAQ